MPNSYATNCDCTGISDTIMVTSELDAGEGSLRCALECANESDNFNHILFDIPESEVFTIKPDSVLPVLKGNLALISSVGQLILDGANLDSEGDHGLRIDGDSILIAGLVIQNFPNNAIDNYQGNNGLLIKDNLIKDNGRLSEFGDAIDLRQSSKSSIFNNNIRSNTKDGIHLQMVNDITILGNTIQLNKQNGINIFQSENLILGDSCNNCTNLISGNFENGIRASENSKNIEIYNNIIGLTRTGEMAFPNKLNGIYLKHCDSIQIGNTERENYISGNTQTGVTMEDSCTHIDLQKNFIGFSTFENVGIPNGFMGVNIHNSFFINIGGESGSLGNKIGHHAINIYVGDSSQYTSIRHNNLYCSINSIQIDPGSNMDVSPPVFFEINDAYTISGIEDAYTEVQVYKKNPECFNCQGNELLGSVHTFTGAWTLQLDQPLFDGDIIAILRTDAQGNTSMFSECISLLCDPFNVEITPSNGPDLCQGSRMTLSTDIGERFFWSTGEEGQEIEISEGGEYMVTVLNELGCPAIDTIFISELPSPELSLEPSNDTIYFCGESILIKGRGEGFFTWDNGTSGPVLEVFQSGTYCVSLTNVYNCTVFDCITVIKGGEVNAEIDVLGEPSFCHGESVELSASGGSLYQWSTGEYNEDTIRVFQSGDYGVTVSNDAGCLDSTSVSINVFPGVNASIEPSGLVSLCHGDSIYLKAEGEGNNYLWSDGSENQQLLVDQLGVYFVTIENDYGCSDESYQTVSIKPEIDAEAFPDTIIEICPGDSALFFVGGKTILDSVYWENGETTDSLMLDKEGVWSIEMFVYGCSVIDSVELSFLDKPGIYGIHGPAWSHPDSIQQFSIINPDTSHSYQWIITGGTLVEETTTSTIDILWGNEDQGKICVEAIDLYGCSSESFCKIVDLAPLEYTNPIPGDIQIYPNPTDGDLTIQLAVGGNINNIVVEFFTPLGGIYERNLLKVHPENQNAQTNISNLSSGFYWVKISNNSKVLSTHNLIIRK